MSLGWNPARRGASAGSVVLRNWDGPSIRSAAYFPRGGRGVGCQGLAKEGALVMKVQRLGKSPRPPRASVSSSDNNSNPRRWRGRLNGSLLMGTQAW